jgi:hypothetical protein
MRKHTIFITMPIKAEDYGIITFLLRRKYYHDYQDRVLEEHQNLFQFLN